MFKLPLHPVLQSLNVYIYGLIQQEGLLSLLPSFRRIELCCYYYLFEKEVKKDEEKYALNNLN